MIILTGAAGFIGSAYLRKLNTMGRDDILLVGHMTPEKEKNLSGKQFIDFIDKTEFLNRLNKNSVDRPEYFVHMGACSSTMLQDEAYYRENNLEYTQRCCEWCLAGESKFIYASSAATYGAGENGYCDADEVSLRLAPLNFYGWSKQHFDLWALTHKLTDRITGFKFFNVFGPNEYHKKDMQSVLCKKFPGIRDTGEAALFKSGRPDYADGEQKRDFIYIKDAVEVMSFFMEHPEKSGIFNVGTGRAGTWKELILPVFEFLKIPPRINFVDMPEILRPKYQYLTCADLTKLRRAGYEKDFMPLRDAVLDYCRYLSNNEYY